jgi:Fe-S oxidoreductase
MVETYPAEVVKHVDNDLVDEVASSSRQTRCCGMSWTLRIVSFGYVGLVYRNFAYN